MALTDAESTFVESILGHIPDVDCYVYHIANHTDPRESRDYFNSYEITNHVGISTVYRKYENLEAKLYIIIMSPTGETPSIPAEMTDLVSGLGE
jgi:hypothetical protein